jgi:hypothetical protein
MVSSTVPRLLDRWPPVWLTLCSRKSRSCCARRGSSAARQRRRSAGLSMVFSRGIRCGHVSCPGRRPVGQQASSGRVGRPLRDSAAWAWACSSAAWRAGAPGPARSHRWACWRPGPCRRSCPAWRIPASRRGCRPPPGRPAQGGAVVGPAPARPRASAAPAGRAHLHAASSSAPVLRRCMSRSCFSVSGADAGQVDGLAAGHAGVARRARQQAAEPRLQRGRMSKSTGIGGVSSSKASVCIASPASMAWASPNCTCTVGLPRRSTSLSMQGMSSCTSE